ncbi:hypothetical protein ABEG17_04100 [Pedococcus sp. KACC 23699]|uniref:Uncharacterized protein n=1 Tax=Pedococcus sp. KACC 23699 TaxID=3149228 RepID=A0AAU7JWA7_9MICO
MADGSARAFGENSEGQPGDGTKTRRPSPVTVTGLTTVAQPSAG